eukprot:7373848-Lingulodinium_polyedra.AAC.1
MARVAEAPRVQDAQGPGLEVVWVCHGLEGRCIATAPPASTFKIVWQEAPKGRLQVEGATQKK